MKKLLLCVMFLTMATLAFGQGSRYESVASTVNTVGGVTNVQVVLPGSSVRVCTFGAVGTPCSPLAQLCTDITCSSLSGANPFTADTVGNIGFYAKPGKYTYQVSFSNVVTGTFDITLGPDAMADTEIPGNWQFKGRPKFFLGVDDPGVLFANLGTPVNGRRVYCTDCAQTNPCAGSGTGASAQTVNGVWQCAAGGGGGGGGTPGGANKEIQVNNAGAFGGTEGNTYDSTTKRVSTAVQDNVVTVSAKFNFDACASGCTYTISPTTLTAGANTVTITPVPWGVNGSNSIHYLEIPANGSDGIEWVKLTGGTAVSGASSGTITFTSQYNHSAGYHIKSASTGVQEANYMLTQPTGKLKLDPDINYECRAPIFLTVSDTALDGQYAIFNHNSFSSCIVMGNQTSLWGVSSGTTSISVQNIDFRPSGDNFWNVLPTGTLDGTQPTGTVTIPTCPNGFYAAVPDQLLWLNGAGNDGSNDMVPTTAFGVGEFVMTTAGGTCKPGVSNGTVNLRQATPGVVNISNHAAGYSLSNNVGPYLEDAVVSGGHMVDIRGATSGTNPTTRFQGSVIQVDNDQACFMDSLNISGGHVVREDPDFWFGAGIFAPGPFATNAAVCWIAGANISNPTSCIRWYAGNDLSWVGGVCQNFQMGGVIIGQKRGGFGKYTLGPGIHFENGSAAPIFPGTTSLGNPSIMVVGASNKPVEAYGEIGGTFSSNSASYPRFSAIAGATQTQHYYLIAHNNTLTGCTSGGDCMSAPIYIGQSWNNDTSADPVPVSFIGWGSGTVVAPTPNPSSYDLLRVTDTTQAAFYGANSPDTPQGTGNFAIATGLTPATICNNRNLCTITDNVGPTASSYTVSVVKQTSNKRYYPLMHLLPGIVSISAQGLANATTPHALYRGTPTCLNSVEFQGPFTAGEFNRKSGGSENDVYGCPHILAPVISKGGSMFCYSANGTCNGSTNGVGATQGVVSIAAAATTVTVTTRNILPWSQVVVTESPNRAAYLGLTCNTTTGRIYTVSNVVPYVSFTITASAAPVTNPACLEYEIR